MSDNYIVSARKYRPQTFDTVVGQGHITTTLKNAIKNQHLAHAYLFCGPRGVGKTTCARILAKTINCEHPTADMEACGVCPTCESLKNNASFNVFELDAASNNGVEHIRELTDQVRFAPQHGKYKVYIIDEVHMLSASAFNAFLKTLEEPPSYAIFILATTEKHKILPTILSRCQIFDFKRITTDDITSHLQSIAGKESMVAQEAALHIIAQKSEGCMRDALSMLDRIASFTNGMLTYANTMEHLNLLDADFYFQLVDHMLSQDVASTLLQLDKALDKGFEGDLIINGLGMHFRNLLLCKDPRMAKMLDIPNEFKPLYHEKANQAPPSYIISAINIINDCELHYKSAANRRLHVELCLLRMCYLQQAIAGQQTVTIAEDVKKKPEPRTVTEANSINNTSVESSKSVDYELVAEKIATTSIPAKVSESSAPVSHSAPVVTTAPIPQAAPKPANRRLSMGMLADIEAQVNKAAEEVDQSEKILTEVTALTLFEKYKQKLVHETKNIIHAQFLMMQVQVLPPDELRLISPSELTDTYARDQRTALQDFYKLETKMNVRITTEIRLDETGNSLQNQPVVLSRSEMYDAMVQKNPNLARLKDALNMQVEY